MSPSASRGKSLLAGACPSRGRSAARCAARPCSASGSIVSRCWRASTSVGAISAAWAPASTAMRHGHQRDDRLAGADIALQQAQHALRRADVGGDLARAPCCCERGQREGQRVGDAGADAAVAVTLAPALGLEAVADDAERQLVGQQLVEGEALPGRARRRDVGGLLRRCRRRKAALKLGQPRGRSQRRVLPFRQARARARAPGASPSAAPCPRARRSADRPARGAADRRAARARRCSPGCVICSVSPYCSTRPET